MTRHDLLAGLAARRLPASPRFGTISNPRKQKQLQIGSVREVLERLCRTIDRSRKPDHAGLADLENAKARARRLKRYRRMVREAAEAEMQLAGVELGRSPEPTR